MVSPFDMPETDTCVQLEDDLVEAARIIREGGDLTDALPALAAHLRGCARCRELLAELMGEPEEWPDVRVGRVDPSRVFEPALLGGLSAREPLVRARAAERLGQMERPGPVILGALAGRAGRDVDAAARKAALAALGLLDEKLPIPDRLIEMWSSAPPDRAPLIAGALERLARCPVPSVVGFGALRPTRSGLVVGGQDHLRGTLDDDRDLWLRLTGLPRTYEQTRPVVAMPAALAAQGLGVDWAGDQPGLVPSDAPVDDRDLDVLLGQGGPAREEPFRRMYLLNPEIRGVPQFE